MKPLLIELLQKAGLRYFQVSTGNKGLIKARLTADGFERWLQHWKENISKAHCGNSELRSVK